MTVRALMTTDLVSVSPDTPLAEATRLLIRHRITGLPVVDADQRIVGVITELDLIRTAAEPHVPWRTVGQLMTPDPTTVNVDAPLVAVFDCLMTHSFRRVLVEDGGRLVGLISRSDLLPTILDHLTEDAEA